MISLPKIELSAAGLRLLVGVACALALALLIHDRNRWKAKTARYAETLAAERSVNDSTLANVRAAAEQARSIDRANAERVRARQSDINRRSKDDFERRLADVRDSALSLREGQPAAADTGAGGAKTVPSLSAAAGGAAETAGQDRLLNFDKLIATEQAIQLDELIKWVERQHEIDMGSATD